MATAPLIHLRTPSAIVCDLATVRQRVASLLARQDETGPEYAERCRLEDRQTVLESELQSAVYSATGVSWDLLAGVMS